MRKSKSSKKQEHTHTVRYGIGMRFDNPYKMTDIERHRNYTEINKVARSIQNIIDNGPPAVTDEKKTAEPAVAPLRAFENQ